MTLLMRLPAGKKTYKGNFYKLSKAENGPFSILPDISSLIQITLPSDFISGSRYLTRSSLDPDTLTMWMKKEPWWSRWHPELVLEVGTYLSNEDKDTWRQTSAWVNAVFLAGWESEVVFHGHIFAELKEVKEI